MAFKFNPFTGTLDVINNDHLNLKNIGTNTHAQIDTHIANVISNPHEVNASLVDVTQCGVPTYKTVQDWMNTTQASGIISGGGFTSNGDGSLTVAAGQGIIRATNSDIAEACFFNWSENDSVSLVDNQTNYIYVDYNSGSPIVGSETTKTANNRTKIFLGKVFREGNNLDLIEAGMVLSEATKRILTYLTTVFGEIKRASGVSVSESGTRNLNVTAGVVFAGLTRIVTSALDTSITGNFELYYYNGSAWIESDQTQIPNSQYNNIATGLVNLTSNRYGVYWVYGSATGDVFVLYGQDNYTLANAEVATPPTSLPNHVAQFGFIAAKIIVQEGAVNFLSVESAYDTQFTSSGVIIHNETSGLNDGDYKHLTATNHTDLTDGGATTLHKHSHTSLDDIGTNTHAQIDTHVGSNSNPHSVSASDVGNSTAQWNANKIQSVTVDDTAKADGYVLTYDSSSGTIIYAAGGGGGGGFDPDVDAFDIGSGASATGNYSIGLGKNTNVTCATGGIGLGYACDVDQNQSINIGYQVAKPAGAQAIQIGVYGGGTSALGISIGYDTSASTGGIAIGRSATSSGTYSFSLGYESTASETRSYALGHSAVSSAQYALAFAANATASGDSAVAIGRLTVASATSTVAIGQSADATIIGGIAIGVNAQATTGNDTIAIGNAANAAHYYSVAIGKNSVTTRNNQIILGSAAYTNDVTVFGGLFIEERTSAFTDKAGFGQLWTKDNAGTTELWFTDDAGNDTQIV